MTGEWVRVSYKRSVDKTSQGLRERDREEAEGTHGSGKNEGPLPEMTADQVPASFRGRTSNPNLSDLAEVAIAHAVRTSDLPRNASDLVTARRVSEHQRQEEDLSPLPPSLQPRQSSMFRLLKDMPPLMESASTTTASAPPAPAYPTKLKNLNVASKKKGKKKAPPMDGQATARKAPPVASPTRVSTSSGVMYPHQPAGPMGSVTGYPPPHMGVALGMFPQFRASPSGVLGPLHSAAFLQSQSLGGGYGLPMAGYGPSISGLVPPTLAGVASAGGDAASAPSLTRMKSQVSDWLKGSFWPISGPPPSQDSSKVPIAPMPGDTDEEKRPGSKKMSRHLAVSTAHAITKLIPPPPPGVMNDRKHLKGSGRKRYHAKALAEIRGEAQEVTEAEPEGRIVQPPLPKKQKTNRMNSVRLQRKLPVIKTLPPPEPTRSPQIKTIPPMATAAPPVAMTSEDTVNSGESNTEVPGRDMNQTELEKSVSASLLALASAPSRFLQGITGFSTGFSTLFGERSESSLIGDTAGQFDDASTSADAAAMPPEERKHPAGSGNPPVTFRKATRSLLEDDDETPDEVRLRTTNGPYRPQVVLKKSKRSLLEDDDDHENSRRPAAQADERPPPVAFRRSKRSLLEDDDETPDEARLRTVTWK